MSEFVRPAADRQRLGACGFRFVAWDAERRCQASFAGVRAGEEIGIVLGSGVDHVEVLDQKPHVGSILAAQGDQLHGRHMLRWRDVHDEPRFRWSPSGSLRHSGGISTAVVVRAVGGMVDVAVTGDGDDDDDGPGANESRDGNQVSLRLLRDWSRTSGER